jgi:hypothetical protein
MSLHITVTNPSNPEQFYTLSIAFSSTDPYFIKNQDGEGMGFNRQQLFDSLDEWFKENI